MSRYLLSALGAACCLLPSVAIGFNFGKVTVYNMTDKLIAVAPYHVLKKEPFHAIRYGRVVTIWPQRSAQVERPSLTLRYDSELFFVFDGEKEVLAKELRHDDIVKMGHGNIGRSRGFNAYIFSRADGSLEVSTSLMKDVVLGLKAAAAYPLTLPEKIVSMIVVPLTWAIRLTQLAVIKNPYVLTKAHVRTGNELCSQERDYRARRLPKTREALARFAGVQAAQKVPVVAVCASGGGYRAMIAAAGYFAGLEEVGLLDGVTYAVGLSGSTWALNEWMMLGGTAGDMRNRLAKKMGQNIKKISQEEIKLLLDALLVKWSYGQEVTLVDLYGGLLANRLFQEFGAARQRVYLSGQAEKIKNGERLFPIYSSVSGKEEESRKWYEYTPYEIGGAWVGQYVPTWAYGRRFVNGVSVDTAPEQSLGHLCGTYGSAFAITLGRFVAEATGQGIDWYFNEILRDIKGMHLSLPAPVLNFVRTILNQITAVRVSSARIFNFTRGMASSPVVDPKKLSFVDAGLDFNLPYPPVSGERAERRADILIFLDASASVRGAPELKKVEAYARRKGLAFPPIRYEGIETRAISIFKDERDPSVPLVIYLPLVRDAALINAVHASEKIVEQFKELVSRVKDFDVESCIKKSFCNTFNFDYTEKQALQMSALAEFNVRASATAIKEAIAWKMGVGVRKN